MTEEFLVPRTCIEIAEREGGEASSRPLHVFRECSAYVLLGEPGAGKSKAFKMEAEACGADAVLVSARDFITLPCDEWRGKTLFIDGLDEMRAGSTQGGAALDNIRKVLQQLGRPKFRLSCRAADWYGASDRQGLEQVSPDGVIAVLQLDPLTLVDIHAILENRLAEGEATAFMGKADALGMQDWLTNPQTLNMLIEAVTKGQRWPESRQETYELACRRMVREHSKRHRDATRGSQYSDEVLLESAGWLCAVLLLSDQAGFALDDDKASDTYATLSQLSPPDMDLPLVVVLKSRLFKPDGVERFIPVHRSVAEYLGAHWLANRINQHGLPLGRVLALMTGADGGVVTGLRGLYAWLAVFGIPWRSQLIERDALGLVLYGDVKEFPKEDKRRVLDILHREAEQHVWLNYNYHDAPRFGALATADMEEVFREILNLAKPDPAWLVVMDCIMDALQYGESLSGLADDLLRIVRDSHYWPTLRKGALRAFMRITASDAAAPVRLLRLLDEIRDGVVEDADDELLGVLLNYLYPVHISPTHLLDYLHPPKQHGLIGAYCWFWAHEVHEKTPENDVPELLDQWVARNISDQKWVYRNTLDGIKGKFLLRGVLSVGQEIDIKRLYEWLGIGVDRHGYSGHLEREHAEAIAAWLHERPERYKAIILYGAKQCLNAENVRICLYQVNARLYNAPPPDGMAEWYLQQADDAVPDELAQAFFDNAVGILGKQSQVSPFDLDALEYLENWVAQHPRFLALLAQYISCPLNDGRLEHAQWKREHDIELEKNKNAWMQYFRQHQAVIRDGSAHPKVLADLASAYFGHFYEASGETPVERLNNFLDHDASLVEDALSGFRYALRRNDLPSVEKIVASGLKGSRDYLCWPCQAGMELSSPDEVASLDDDQLRKIVAFQHLFSAHGDSRWEDMLRRFRPDLMASVLVQCAIPYLRAGKEHIDGLYGLAYNEESAEIAKYAVLPLLQGFPVRSKKAQLSNLRYLLVAGLRYLEASVFLEVVATKLGLKLDDPQRIYWMAAGMVANPAIYAQPLAQFVGKSQTRAGYAAGFFSERYDQYSLTRALPENCIAWLIELLGKAYPPYDRFNRRDSRVTHAMNMADLVQSWIRHLSSISSQAAGDALATLLAQPALACWHDELRIGLRNQRVIQRDHEFQHPQLERVCKTLSNLQPANPADLAALTLDNLLALREKILHGSTNDYRQYWSFDDSNKALTIPKPENECRDALLSDLQERLGKLCLEAIKEGYYAEDKRADIRVSFGGANGFSVPIEIKKDNHRDLWTAIRNQLISQYTQDPATEGYGIYLVFWFGGRGMPLSGGRKPSSATELEEQLRASLSDDERKRIAVIVMDCSLK